MSTTARDWILLIPIILFWSIVPTVIAVVVFIRLHRYTVLSKFFDDQQDKSKFKIKVNYNHGKPFIEWAGWVEPTKGKSKNGKKSKKVKDQ